MIRPNPIQFTCLCGFSKIHWLKSDVLQHEDIFAKCPKCKKPMESQPLSKHKKF
ncbi:hypothetical protein [Helicobacter aurati]|uniref:hypothetical protein n=1 Tax=Helicobacter aurati TaxID=137778 RepID=UPI0013155AB4|nr:hypothetical protein [Helicobacter aurati]